MTRSRSVEDMPDHPPRVDTALEGLRAACALSTASETFGHGLSAQRGVREFRSVAQAWAHRRDREEAAVRRAATAPRSS